MPSFKSWLANPEHCGRSRHRRAAARRPSTSRRYLPRSSASGPPSRRDVARPTRCEPARLADAGPDRPDSRRRSSSSPRRRPNVERMRHPARPAPTWSSANAKSGTCLNWPADEPDKPSFVQCTDDHVFEVAKPVDMNNFGEPCQLAVREYLGARYDPSSRFTIGVALGRGRRSEHRRRAETCCADCSCSAQEGKPMPFKGQIVELDQSRVWPVGHLPRHRRGAPAGRPTCPSTAPRRTPGGGRRGEPGRAVPWRAPPPSADQQVVPGRRRARSAADAYLAPDEAGATPVWRSNYETMLTGELGGGQPPGVVRRRHADARTGGRRWSGSVKHAADRPAHRGPAADPRPAPPTVAGRPHAPPAARTAPPRLNRHRRRSPHRRRPVVPANTTRLRAHARAHLGCHRPTTQAPRRRTTTASHRQRRRRRRDRPPGPAACDRRRPSRATSRDPARASSSSPACAAASRCPGYAPRRHRRAEAR